MKVTLHVLDLAQAICIRARNNSFSMSESEYIKDLRSYIDGINIFTCNDRLQAFIDAENPDDTPVGHYLLKVYRNKKARFSPTGLAATFVL